MLNRADRITDGVKARVGSILAEVTRQNKGLNPYRKAPATDKQRLETFYQRPPDWEEQLLNSGYSPQDVQQYQDGIDKVMRRQSDGGT